MGVTRAVVEVFEEVVLLLWVLLLSGAEVVDEESELVVEDLEAEEVTDELAEVLAEAEAEDEALETVPVPW